jgi:hypothetical protein
LDLPIHSFNHSLIQNRKSNKQQWSGVTQAGFEPDDFAGRADYAVPPLSGAKYPLLTTSLGQSCPKKSLSYPFRRLNDTKLGSRCAVFLRSLKKKVKIFSTT